MTLATTVHLLLFAAREVVQESLSFSPAELVFAHTGQGPLSLVYDKWLSIWKQQNLCDYVSNFRFKLHRACQLARENLSVAQSKMKTWFDKSAKSQSFNPADKVLVRLPVIGSAFTSTVLRSIRDQGESKRPRLHCGHAGSKTKKSVVPYKHAKTIL